MKIVTVPNSVLSSPTKPVVEIDSRIKKIIADMEKVLVAQNDPPGVGLAANQVGIDLSIFIIKPTEKAKTKVFINPKIIKRMESDGIRQSQMKSDKSDSIRLDPIASDSIKKKHKKVKLEGCLSIPRIWGPVKRADRVFLKYQDLTGQEFIKWFDGMEAIIIQHEMDHLSGVVFTQRALEQKRQIYREEGDELVKIEY
jgi:peptide deformylase